MGKCGRRVAITAPRLGCSTTWGPWGRENPVMSQGVAGATSTPSRRRRLQAAASTTEAVNHKRQSRKERRVRLSVALGKDDGDTLGTEAQAQSPQAGCATQSLRQQGATAGEKRGGTPGAAGAAGYHAPSYISSSPSLAHRGATPEAAFFFASSRLFFTGEYVQSGS